MTSVTRRAVRTTAAITGIAALGTGLAGAAAALPVLDGLPVADAVPTKVVPDVLGLIPAAAQDAAIPALGGVEMPKIAAPMSTAGLPALPALPGAPGLPQLPDAGGVLATAQQGLGAPVTGSSVTPPSLVPDVASKGVPTVSDAPTLAKSLADQALARQISGNALTM